MLAPKGGLDEVMRVRAAAESSRNDATFHRMQHSEFHFPPFVEGGWQAVKPHLTGCSQPQQQYNTQRFFCFSRAVCLMLAKLAALVSFVRLVWMRGGWLVASLSTGCLRCMCVLGLCMVCLSAPSGCRQCALRAHLQIACCRANRVCCRQTSITLCLLT